MRDPFTECAFCDRTHLGDQGDETTQYLEGVVRVGRDRFVDHPYAHNRRVLWCGVCAEGRKHKYQRYDNQNLRGLLAGIKARLEVDPIKWYLWEFDANGPRIEEEADDFLVHNHKLDLADSIPQIEAELVERTKDE